MTSIAYDASRPSLYTPGLATDFFTWGAVPGEPALCAEMARLAYVKDSRLEPYLDRAGFRLVARIGDAQGTQGFVAEGVASVVLAFRGTESDDPMDLVSDAEFVRTRWPRAGGAAFVHGGFADALESCWSDVERLLPDDRRLIFTGHSLGAALATLAASLRAPDYLATFGSPLVGDAAFVRSLDGVAHDRFVGCCDLVTRVPPEAFGYAHAGTLHYIDRHGVVTRSPAGTAIDADRRNAFLEYLPTSLRKGTVALRELADHAPINYVSAVMGVRAPAR